MLTDILGAGKGKNPFPGYELKTGTLFSGGFQTFTWDKSKIIPLIIHINCSGGGNYYNARRAYFNLNNKSKTILYLEDIDPGSCRGSTESDICTLSFATFDQMKNIGSCSFSQGGGGNGFSLTATCTLWLEKSGGGVIVRISNYLKNLLLSHYLKFLRKLKTLGSEVSTMLFDILGASKKNDRLYLFKDGDQCTSVTGGWINTVVGNGGSYSASISETLYIGGSGNGTKYFQPVKNLPDDVLKKYDYVFFEFRARSYDDDNGGNCLFSGGVEYAVNNKWNRDRTRIVALPLTSLLINFGLSMGGHSTSYMWVSKVWLEKVGA